MSETRKASVVVTTTIDAIVQYGNRGHYFGFAPDDASANLIECVDGFRLSVIAGGGTYSVPRVAFCTCAFDRARPVAFEPFALMYEQPHDFRGPYSALEVGFPSERPEPWSDWVDHFQGDPEGDPTENVYAGVPSELVRALVISHGGEIEKPDSFYGGPS